MTEALLRKSSLDPTVNALVSYRFLNRGHGSVFRTHNFDVHLYTTLFQYDCKFFDIYLITKFVPFLLKTEFFMFIKIRSYEFTSIYFLFFP